MPTTGSYDPIRPSDLKDPTLNKLNLTLQRLFAAVGLTGSGTSQKSYVPQISGAGLTITTVSSKRAQYSQIGTTVTFALDVTFTIAGTGASLTISPPVLPDSYTAGTAFSCTIVSGGTMAGGNAILSNASFVVGLASGVALPTGTVEILLSGSYQAAS